MYPGIYNLGLRGNTVKIVCAWCNKTIKEKHLKHSTNNAVSHGICPACARKMLSKLSMPMTIFLDKFPAPVFMVDGEGNVLSANSKAYAMLDKKPADVDGKPGGEAVNCLYANHPGGCGKTIHCKSCTIRMTVTDTIETGRSHLRIPAYPDLHMVTGEKQIQFFISTLKVGDTIFLIVDEINLIDKNKSYHFPEQEEMDIKELESVTYID